MTEISQLKAAWDTIDALLKQVEELKGRVEELEREVESEQYHSEMLHDQITTYNPKHWQEE